VLQDATKNVRLVYYNNHSSLCNIAQDYINRKSEVCTISHEVMTVIYEELQQLTRVVRRDIDG